MKKLLAVVIAFVLLGCGSGPGSLSSRLEPMELPQSEWGMPFVHIPIAQAAPQVQAWGKAIAFVQTAKWHGTGFFISPDGLFLTNEHVINRDLCNRDVCRGFKIVREFAPGGDVEIFSEFSLVAQSTLDDGLDFTLLKVRLKPGQTVPFLKLASPSSLTTEEKEAQWQDLTVLGHPMGSSLRASPASYSFEEGSEIYLHSVAVSGNSGGPLLDQKSGNVIGLYHAGYWEKSQTQADTGFTPHYGQAIAFAPIWDQWGTAFPRVAKRLSDSQSLKEPSVALTVSDFEIRNPFISVLPQALATAVPDVLTRAGVNGFFDRSYLTPQFEKLAHELVLKMAGSELRHEFAASFVANWENYALAYGKTVPLLPAQIAQLLEAYIRLSPEVLPLRLRIKTLWDPQSVESCLSEANRTMPDSATLAVTREISSCGALASRHPEIAGTSATPVSPLQFLLNEGDHDFADWGAAPLRRVWGILRYHLIRGAITRSEYPRLLHALEVAAPRSVMIGSAFGAEGLHTLLLRAPQIVEPGFLR